MQLAAIFRKGEISIEQIKEGEILPILFDDFQMLELPKIRKDDVCNEDIAKNNEIIKSALKEIKNLDYKETEDGFEVYDTTCFEVTTIEIPIYVEMFNNYKATGKFHQLQLYSSETIEAANKITKVAKKLIAKSKREAQIKEYAPFFEEFENKLDENNGIACIRLDGFNYEAFHLFLSVKKYHSYKLTLWNFPLYIVSKKNSFDSVKLIIPKEYEEDIPLFIGKGGNRVKKIADYFNANYIKFVIEN